MAQTVGPSGYVTGLDVSDAMLALSQRRCGDLNGAGRVGLVKADATALPFPDATFDAATSIQVYEYVADLSTALAELHRVLQPGGRALILDTDWDSIVWHATDTDRMRRLLAAWTQRFADPYLPRSLASELRAVGFKVNQPQVLVLLNVDYSRDTYSIANGEIMADFAVTRGQLTREEANAWLADLHQVGSQGRYFFSLRGHSGTSGWLGGAMIPAHDHPGRPPAARPALAAPPAPAACAAIPRPRRRTPHRARPGLHGRDHLHGPHLH